MGLQTRPFRIMIGDGTAIPSTFATILTGDLAIVKRDMSLLAVGNTIADSDVIYIAQGTASGPILSAPIKGTQVSRWAGEAFAPGRKQTTHIGHDRITAQSINVLNDTEYSIDIVLKDDKDLYSNRQLRKVYFYTSSASATATAIAQGLAAQIQKDINESGEQLPLQVIVVGDGTGDRSTATVGGIVINTHDMTAATNVGIEISGTEYTFSALKGYNKVFFEVGLASGFDSTVVVANTQTMALGSGVYAQVYMKEDEGLLNWGFTNRRLHPVAQPTRYASATGTYAASVTNGVAVVASDDEITLDAGHAAVAGNILRITDSAAGVGSYEIKFFISTNVAVLSSAFAGTTDANADYEIFSQYDMYAITHNDDSSSGTINGQSVNPPLVTMVAIPANSTQAANLEALLNPWMASTPAAFTAVVL